MKLLLAFVGLATATAFAPMALFRKHKHLVDSRFAHLQLDVPRVSRQLLQEPPPDTISGEGPASNPCASAQAAYSECLLAEDIQSMLNNRTCQMDAAFTDPRAFCESGCLEPVKATFKQLSDCEKLAPSGQGIGNYDQIIRLFGLLCTKNSAGGWCIDLSSKLEVTDGVISCDAMSDMGCCSATLFDMAQLATDGGSQEMVVAVGETCSDSNQVCIEGSLCQSNYSGTPQMDPETGCPIYPKPVCLALSVEGDACPCTIEYLPEADRTPQLQCFEETCAFPLIDGAPCQFGSNCASGACDQFLEEPVCYAPLQIGATCEIGQSRCKDLCISGKCSKPLANGMACDHTHHCISGICLTTCMDPQEIGAVCQLHTDCQDWCVNKTCSANLLATGTECEISYNQYYDETDPCEGFCRGDLCLEGAMEGELCGYYDENQTKCALVSGTVCKYYAKPDGELSKACSVPVVYHHEVPGDQHEVPDDQHNQGNHSHGDENEQTGAFELEPDMVAGFISECGLSLKPSCPVMNEDVDIVTTTWTIKGPTMASYTALDEGAQNAIKASVIVDLALASNIAAAYFAVTAVAAGDGGIQITFTIRAADTAATTALSAKIGAGISPATGNVQTAFAVSGLQTPVRAGVVSAALMSIQSGTRFGSTTPKTTPTPTPAPTTANETDGASIIASAGSGSTVRVGASIGLALLPLVVLELLNR